MCRLEAKLAAVTEQRDEAREQRDKLQQWKNDQMTVNSEWDVQTVGKLLGLRIGESITLNIEPKIRELINQRDRLAEALEECKEDSIELLGERDWWQNEPRCGHKKRYEETSENITRADKILAIVKGVSNE
jgi:antitoxin component of MazEF toxin-antitoxin module